MAKKPNPILLEQAKMLERLKRMTEDNCAYVYAAFGIVLHNIGYDHDQIEEIFNQTVEIHNSSLYSGQDSLLSKCEELTGICLVSSDRAKREGGGND